MTRGPELEGGEDRSVALFQLACTDANFRGSCPLIVKNTFIDLPLLPRSALRALRRSASTPPRLGTSEFIEEPFYEQSNATVTVSASVENSTRGDDEACCNASRNDVATMSGVPRKHGRSPLNPHAKLWGPVASVSMAPVEALDAWGQNSKAQAYMYYTEGNTGQRARPHSKPFAGELERQAAGVAAAMHAAVQASGYMATMHSLPSSNGSTKSDQGSHPRWKIVASTAPCHFRRLLRVAQLTLLQASKQANGICLLGNGQPTPNGFTATLGEMQDERTGCWDLYNKGLCPRGCGCPWSHPMHTMSISVTVQADHQVEKLPGVATQSPQ